MRVVRIVILAALIPGATTRSALADAPVQASPPAIGYTAPPLETFGYSADPLAEGIELGRQVYTQWCAICHEGGPGMAGTESLQRKYRGEVPALLRERRDLAPDVVAVFVRAGVKSMPNFRKTEISDEQLAALTAYLTAATSKPPGGRVEKK